LSSPELYYASGRRQAKAGRRKEFNMQFHNNVDSAVFHKLTDHEMRAYKVLRSTTTMVQEYTALLQRIQKYSIITILLHLSLPAHLNIVNDPFTLMPIRTAIFNSEKIKN
jgi:hypothetical protein